MLSKKDKETLRNACDIIIKELKNNNSISIPKFGKFYITEIKVSPGFSIQREYEPKVIKSVVRFRPWDKLKKAFSNGENKRLYCPHCGAIVTIEMDECLECYLPIDTAFIERI